MHIWLHHLVQLSSGGLRHLRSYYSMTLFRLECCDTRRSSIAQTAYAKACRKMWCKIWLWSVLSLGWLEIFEVYVHALYRNRYSPEICSHVFLVKWFILFSEPQLCLSSAKSLCRRIKKYLMKVIIGNVTQSDKSPFEQEVLICSSIFLACDWNRLVRRYRKF